MIIKKIWIGDKKMNISNFKLVDVIGSGPLTWKFKATVTVTTKTWFGKPVAKKRDIFKRYAGHWYFIDNGEFVPSGLADNLARKLEAEKGVELHKCLDT